MDAGGHGYVAGARGVQAEASHQVTNDVRLGQRECAGVFVASHPDVQEEFGLPLVFAREVALEAVDDALHGCQCAARDDAVVDVHDAEDEARSVTQKIHGGVRGGLDEAQGQHRVMPHPVPQAPSFWEAV